MKRQSVSGDRCPDDREDDIELREIGVLELVDKDVPEPGHEVCCHKSALFKEQSPCMEDQV